MRNCSHDLLDYHRDKIQLSSNQKAQLRDRRDANRGRIRDGLNKAGIPQPQKFVSQGSYAMQTTIQEPENDYDIDDGVVFNMESLRGPRRANKTALEARQMIRDIVDDGSFKTATRNQDKLCEGLLVAMGRSVSQGSYAMQTTIQEPENDYDIDDGVVFNMESLRGPRRANKTALEARQMIRDIVDDGSFKTPPEIKHVDIPVYRETSAEQHYELASADWKESDPEGVNGWFKDESSLSGEDGRIQIRQIIRLMKAFCVARQSYALPSGFVLTVLILENYVGFDERLDRALRNVMEKVRDRLNNSLYVRHPVVDEWLIDSKSSSKTEKLRDVLSNAIDELKTLDLPSCSRSKALRIWKWIFLTDYFGEKIGDAEADEKATTSAAIISSGQVPKPYGRMP